MSATCPDCGRPRASTTQGRLSTHCFRDAQDSLGEAMCKDNALERLRRELAEANAKLEAAESQLAAAQQVGEASAARAHIAEFRAWSIKSQTCKHKTEQESSDAECFLCGTLDCPTVCELHYHHDGCADCDCPGPGPGPAAAKLSAAEGEE